MDFRWFLFGSWIVGSLSEIGFWFFFGFFIHSFSGSSFGHWIGITYRSYLTIQTYYEAGMGAREEVLDLVVDEYTVDIVELLLGVWY